MDFNGSTCEGQCNQRGIVENFYEHSPIFNDTVMMASIIPGEVGYLKGKSLRIESWWALKNAIEIVFDKKATPYSLKTKNYIRIRVHKICHHSKTF